MKNLQMIKERYLKESLSRRLGAIAANLARAASFSKLSGGSEVLRSLLIESQYFIEWTVFEADGDLQERLVKLQVQIARWRYRLDHGRGNAGAMESEFRQQADELIEIAGLAA